ncbi:DNA cytosine methyltransferase [Pseudomonas mosselii]|uniref:DNA cytosine methyltransferase n=1 Tax=Pseudomonas mosselii TaxID=78327 RepID=UPI0009F2EB55|nr:DNA cytosine methyltransferase [Pseudomonas mosselii]
MNFIDVFAGCGGLSLGLLKAGCNGVLAIEKNPMAFETLRHNLIEGDRHQFAWPNWLPRQAMGCEEFLKQHQENIANLRGKIDLMVGGPPCQGFSTAGRRDPSDPRNKMADHYLELVKIIMPQYIVIENVTGFNSKFTKKTSPASISSKSTYADFICSELSKIGYTVSRGKVNCADFGVPQNRRRYLIICHLGKSTNLFEELIQTSHEFRRNKGLPVNRPISVHEAIGDLEVRDRKLTECLDSSIPGFVEAIYQPPQVHSPYLKIIRDNYSPAPNSRRLPKHKPETIVQFRKIQMASQPGRSLSKLAREGLGLKKHSITVLTKNEPAPTITTLPDDVIHYNELRILTARETARLQSFPDWFEFTGKYTTGGKQRKLECPRYTQIGNAVPPLLSEAIGRLLIKKAKITEESSTPSRDETINASPKL